MTAREKLLAMVVGTAIVLGLGYKGVNVLFIGQYTEAAERLEKLTAENDRLDGIISSREGLARRWLKCVGRTFSFEKAEAQGMFGQSLKDIAKRHGFDDAVFSTSTGLNIGRKTNIGTVAHRITVEGGFDEVLAFLRDLYDTPYLCQITKLTLSPLGSKNARGAVKLEFSVESPLVPKIDPQKIPHVRNAQAMPIGPGRPLDAFRTDLQEEEYFQIMAARNAFRAYLPPPLNVVMVDNRDRKTVALKVDFFWDYQINEQLVETVAGKSTLSVKGKGDIVEIVGTYADGVTFGPQRMEFDGRKDWTYVVDSHTPAPPPTVIDLALNNQHTEAVYLEIVVTTQDNEQESEPVMWFEPGVWDVREYQDIESVMVTARYSSGTKHLSMTFTPGEEKQTYEVPPEPAEQVVVYQEGGPVPPRDLPADGRFAVTALLTYAEEGEYVQEMIASGNGERLRIRTGETGAVDGGTLLAVVPSLGGVVKMPATGNYYMYPLGSRFDERVLLEARKNEDLPSAIDTWTRR